VIGPNVTVGPSCTVEDGVRLNNCALLEGAAVKANSWVHSSIVGWNSTIGQWVSTESRSPSPLIPSILAFVHPHLLLQHSFVL
jgi:NDP-sugar pyrophosphorylase family protein